MRSRKFCAVLWIALLLLIYIRTEGAFALVLLIMTAVYLLLWPLLLVGLRQKIFIKIAAPHQGEKNMDVTIPIELENKGFLPIPIFHCVLTVNNSVTGRREDKDMELSVQARKRQIDNMTLKDDCCGIDRIEIGEAEIFDPLKIYKRKANSHSRAETLIVPLFGELDIPSDKTEAYSMDSYMYSATKHGSDTSENFGVREYQEGDSPKAIHRKLSAKLGETIVKIPSYPVENNIIVLLEKTTGKEAGNDCILSDTAELFFSVIYTLINKGIHHTIGWYDKEKEKFRTEKIDDLQDVWKYMGMVLSAPFADDGLSIVSQFIESEECGMFANHFIVTAGEEKDIDTLENYGAVNIFEA